MLIQSSSEDRMINLRVFSGLIRELHIRLELTKEGLAPEKVKRKINFGIRPKDERAKTKLKRLQRIEKEVLAEFNMINLARVQSAIEAAADE